MNEAVKVLLKLGACGATIAAIAFAFVTLSPEGEVAPSEADVVDFVFGPKDRTEVYRDALARMGHTKPEPYDLNGNVVYFSSAFAKGSPRQLMEEYQRVLRDEGFNRKAYGPMDNTEEGHMELVEGMVLGDMVPILVEDDHVIMAGGTIKGDPRSPEELEALGMPQTPEEMRDRLDGHKWLEIMRHEEFDDSSMVISTWADDFNVKKMIPGNREPDQNVDTEIPACPGCTRLMKFDSLGTDKLHKQTVYSNASSVEGASGFYVEALRQRGWELTETSDMYEKVRDQVLYEGDDAALLQFTKNDRFLTILAYPDDGGATVQVLQSD